MSNKKEQYITYEVEIYGGTNKDVNKFNQELFIYIDDAIERHQPYLRKHIFKSKYDFFKVDHKAKCAADFLSKKVEVFINEAEYLWS